MYAVVIVRMWKVVKISLLFNLPCNLKLCVEMFLPTVKSYLMRANCTKW